MTKTWQFLSNFFVEAYRSPDEQRYCAKRLKQHDERFSKALVSVSIFFHLIPALFFDILVPKDFLLPMLATHVPVGIFQLMVVITRARIVSFSIAVSVSYLYMIGGHTYILLKVLEHPEVVSIHAVAMSLYLGLHVLHVLTAPITERFGSTLPAVSTLAVLVATMHYEHRELFFIGFYCMVGWTFIARKYNHFILMNSFKAEFQKRSQMLPAIFVEDSIHYENVVDVFPPRERECVFICSDWRSYQKLTVEMGAEQLAAMLGGYYRMCRHLLLKHFPNKNFVLDWIADELIVILFPSSDADIKKIVNQGVEFSIALVETKTRYFDQFRLKQRIDVGIVHGKALVGLMGPSGNLKATALGEKPGRARRLQSYGKNLREKMGDIDRVIMDVDTLLQLSKPFDVREYVITEPIKDLKDAKLFYLEIESMPFIQVDNVG